MDKISDFNKNITAMPMSLSEAAVVRLAEAEAFVTLVREVGMSDDTAIDVLTALKRRGIIVQFV